MPVLPTKVDRSSDRFGENRERMLALLAAHDEQLELVRAQQREQPLAVDAVLLAFDVDVRREDGH